jgi:glycosyltransferase involved in cell wall biosynthesis
MRELAARGHQVTFVCPPESAAEQQLSRLDFEVIPIDPEGGWLAVGTRLRRIFRDRFVEVGFVHTEREQLVVSTATRLADRGAVIRRTPSGGTLTFGGTARFAMRLAATGFLFPSTEEESDSPPLPRRALGAAQAEVGVDVERYDGVQPVSRVGIGAGGSHSRLVVCVCDAESRARVATVLRTMALLHPRHPELRLALLGPGSDQEDLRMHAAALGLTPVVAHLGERDDHLAVLRAADIGWVAARGDNAAYGFLDLMALRTPVIAERGRLAQRYVADGIAGLLLPPADPATNAATVTTFLANEEQRRAMGNAGRVRAARDFSLEQMIDGFAKAAELGRDRARWRV